MEEKILLHLKDGKADVKFKQLKEQFKGSCFEIELITQENESMTGKITFQQWIQIGKRKMIDKLTARGALTIVAVIYILAEIAAGLIRKLF